MAYPGLSQITSPGWRAVSIGLVIICLVLPAAIIGIWLLPISRLLQGALIGVLVIAAAVLLRPPGYHFLGPHFFYDLIRLARRGRSTFVRIIYGIFLLFGLCLVYANQFHIDPLKVIFAPGPVLPANDLAGFAERFVNAILFMQILAVFLLTPAYVAGAIAEEREAGTLDLLFTTHLTDREIVLGKLFARLVHMGGVLLVGLPILSLTMFLGGVDMELILAGFTNTFLALLGVGSLSILVSSQAGNVLGAVLGTYGLIFVLALLCLPFSAISQLTPTGEATFIFDLGHLVLACFCLPVAIFSLRWEKMAGDPSQGPRRPIPPRVMPQPSPPYQAIERPPLRGHPVLWKTMYPAIGVEVFFLLFIYVLAFSTTAFSFALSLASAPETVGLTPLRLWVASFLGVACINVGFQMASSIIRERQNKTLESLLLLPMSAWEILGAIFLGNILRTRFFLLGLAGFYLLGLVTMTFHPFSLAWFCLALVIHVIFFASMGLWVSTVSSSPLWATFTTAVLLVLVLGGPWWFLAVLEPAFFTWQHAMLEVGVNPWGSWWFLMFSWQEWEKADPSFRGKLLTLPAGFAIYVGLSGVFWLLARARLRPK
jgi:ABC-type transport system involved in multi-copper enzyme maturation permease subunit